MPDEISLPVRTDTPEGFMPRPDIPPLRADGRRLRDAHGRHRVLHGINLVAKGRSGEHGDFVARGFAGSWTADDIADLAARGFTFVRLGVIWAAVEPRPGAYDDHYLDWIAEQLDLIHEAGMLAVLDAHQDLYSQRFSDGAPDWATLTDLPFEPTGLWSDAYLTSGAGYDLLNEPAPGSAAPQIFGAVIGAFAQATDQHPEQLLADFADPEAKLRQLARLDDEAVHRAIGDAVHPLVAEFEQQSVARLMARVTRAVRAVDPHPCRRHGCRTWSSTTCT